MKIGTVDLNNEIMVIAEIGNNHEGSYARAAEMIGQAARAGVHAVKFQTIVPEKLVSVLHTERLAQLKKFQLSRKEFEKLSQVAKKENVLFLSTPFDVESVQFLEGLVPAFKIASGDNNFYPLLAAVCRTQKPMLLSTGLADGKAIGRTVRFVENCWGQKKTKADLALLHCVTSYPAPVDQANLLAIQTLQRTFKLTVGYSDHTLGIDAAVLSVALGARIIEKHFTLNKAAKSFRDHQISADFKDLCGLVRRVKEASVLLGDGKLKIEPNENNAITSARRSIVAGKDLCKGRKLDLNDLEWVRPSGGLPPGQEHKILGKYLTRDVKHGEPILIRDVAAKKV